MVTKYKAPKSKNQLNTKSKTKNPKSEGIHEESGQQSAIGNQQYKAGVFFLSLAVTQLIADSPKR
mgnify:CR=1 FL=1